MSSSYANADAPAEPYQWQEKYASSGSGRRKWIMVGSAVVILALIAIGVGVGVSVSHHHSSTHNDASTGGGNSNNPAPSSTVVPQTNPNDPSTFVKDSRLKQSFYGIAYTPEGAVYPNCTSTLSDIITDIQLMSQLTTRLRLYSSDCNQSALVLEAIKQTKVNMSVYLGNFIEPDGGVAYKRQSTVIVDVIKTYGTNNILGITVGNEYMLDYLTAAGATDPNGAVGNVAAQGLIANITDTVNTLKSLNLNKHIPVGNSDAGAYFNTQVLEAVEYGMANDHPWFANVSIDQAAGWTYEFFETTNVQPAAALSNHPTMYIAETGWPSNSSDAANMSNGPSTASIANLQEFLNTYVCQANKNGTGYFYFEAFDELWKDPIYGGVEAHWGIFNADKTLKNVTIPTCS
ncbi:glycoside hydrolase family 17 protein [Russula compacta]|nr:glycoside hydrolase family 17 protein [Russula compacta]